MGFDFDKIERNIVKSNGKVDLEVFLEFINGMHHLMYNEQFREIYFRETPSELEGLSNIFNSFMRQRLDHIETIKNKISDVKNGDDNKKVILVKILKRLEVEMKELGADIKISCSK